MAVTEISTYTSGLAGTANSKFRVVLQLGVNSFNEVNATIYQRCYAEVTTGNFLGSTLHPSWSSSTFKMYGTGTYADTGWVAYTDVAYGASCSKSINAYYLGGSGITYKASVTGTYKPSTPTYTPIAPSNITVSRSSDTSIKISWVNNNTEARPYTSLYIERQTDGGSWTTIASGLSGTSYTDTSTSANHYYCYRVTAVNSAGSATSGTSSIVYNTPNPATGVVNTRNSDSKNTITWTLGASTALITKQTITRSVDGATFATLATLSSSATSYIDTTTSIDHSYQYGIQATNSSTSSSVTKSNTTYNTPKAPDSVTIARYSDTAVLVTIENSSVVATGLKLYRSTDKSTWTLVGTYSSVTDSLTDDPGGGTYWYAVTNTRDSLESDKTISSTSVVNIAAPLQPIILAPAANGVISTEEDTITFEWLHNPIDGSLQTAAQLSYTISSQTYTVTLSDEQSYTITNSYTNGTSITFKVRTKGVYEDYGEWSDSRTFTIYDPPNVVIEEPISVITGIPFDVVIDYIDNGGKFSSGTLSLTGGNYPLEVSITSTGCTIDRSQWTPDDGETYTYTLTVTSTTGLTYTISWDVLNQWDLPKSIYLGIDYDTDLGYAYLTLSEPLGNGAEVEDALLFRITDDERICLSEQALNLYEYIDKYAPINIDYTYEIVMYSPMGAVKTLSYDGRLKSPYAYFYFGEDDSAKAIFNSDGGFDMSYPNEEFVRYAGRTYPVYYDDSQIDETYSLTADLLKRSEMLPFRRLAQNKGVCVYKSLEGAVIHAKATVSFTESYSSLYYGSISVDITRIDGDEL